MPTPALLRLYSSAEVWRCEPAPAPLTCAKPSPGRVTVRTDHAADHRRRPADALLRPPGMRRVVMQAGRGDRRAV